MLILPPRGADHRTIIERINQLIQGRNNATVDVTLTANTTTTIVSKSTINSSAAPLPLALTSNAAAELANGTLYVSDISAGSFTITHANNAQTDRNFKFVVLGG